MLNKNFMHAKNAFTVLCLFIRNTHAHMMGTIKTKAKLKQ